MRKISKIMSTYTADVSGVCSALYELGGMVVMHDPSGCNSTYNTHDEPRWYNSKSLIFISGLTQLQAIMGDDDKLIADISEAALRLKPAFIAIAGTPIVMITGCDLKAIAARVQELTGIVSFAVETGGMHSYVSGASAALETYALLMTDKSASCGGKSSVNILGMTPLDFGNPGYPESLRLFLEENGWHVISNWAMGSEPKDLKRAGEAAVNLVVSSVGLKTAKVLSKLFGTPYVVGMPCGKQLGKRIIDALGRAVSQGKNICVPGEYTPPHNAKTLIIGEAVTARSLSAALKYERGTDSRVICPLECAEEILSENDIGAFTEGQIVACAEGASEVIADPLYRPVFSEKIRFTELAHYAFSGRIYAKSMNILTKELKL